MVILSNKDNRDIIPSSLSPFSWCCREGEFKQDDDEGDEGGVGNGQGQEKETARQKTERLLEVFVSKVKDAALFQHTVITCMEVLNYELEGPEQVGM